MNLLVCFKVVRDLDSAIPGDWAGTKDLSFDIDYTKKMWNCFDEAALETALRLKDGLEKQGGACGLTAVTVCRPGDETEDFEKNLYAVGYEKVVRLEREADLRFAPAHTAELLAEYIRQGAWSAILCGCQASPADNAQTPALLAEMLGLPFVNMAFSLDWADGGFSVVSTIDGGTREARVNSPAVYAFGSARYSYVRVATLREKMAGSKKKAETLNLSANINNMPGPQSGSFTSARIHRQCRMIEGATAEEKARTLFESYLETAL